MYSVLIANKLIREISPADTKSTLLLSPIEFRVKYLMISLVQKETKFFEPIDITTPEFARYFGLSWGGEQTKSLAVSIENLIENSYILDDKIIRWLSPESYISDGKIHLKLDDSLSPYLLKINGNFTMYSYDAVSEFKSRYSFRLYEFFKSAEGMGFFKISLDDAILLLGDGCCKTKCEFIKRVLNPALKEINNHSDITIKRRFHKPFGKSEQIWFSIRNKCEDLSQENIKYHSKSTANNKINNIEDENLEPVDFVIDNRLKKMISDTKSSY